MKRFERYLCFALLLAFLAVSNVTANTEPVKPLKVELAHEWTELFNRMDDGWMGADGVYSFALNGVDSIGSADGNTKTFFTFCDTNLGTVNPYTLKWNEVRMAHNTAAILTGSEPDPEKIEFKYGKNASMSYGPNMRNNSLYGYKVWPQDGILIDNNLYILAHKTDNAMSPLGVDEIKIPIVNGEPDFNSFTVESDVPLFLFDDKYDIQFGAGVLDNTESAGAMDPDGYVYVYGIRCDPKNALDKQLIVARVSKENYTDKSKWEYYNGNEWDKGIENVNNDSAVLAHYVSNELSVTPIDTGIYKGKYMLIYSVGSIIPELEYRIGDTPYGPFDKPVKFYDIPETDYYDGAVVYNAKAHPHLSKPGELLISYNVNLWLVIPDSNEIYRPRFLTLKLDEFAEPTPKSTDKTNIAAKKTATASHNNNGAGKALDKNIKTLWEAKGEGDKWLQVDLGEDYTISRWIVRHSKAGDGLTAYNTKDYKLQMSQDGAEWTDIDAVVYNTAPYTDRTVDPFTARYVRLYITDPTQSADTTARIYEFEVYGKIAEETPEETPGETPAETPDETMETPNETPDETPDETPNETPDETPDETPGETPGESPEASGNMDETPDDTNNVTPKPSGDRDQDNSNTGDRLPIAFLVLILMLSACTIIWRVRSRRTVK